MPRSLTPVYPAPEGVPQSWLRKRIERALRDVEVSELLPTELLARHRLAPLRPSIERLHRPPADADAHALQERTDAAWQRLKFDELLAQQLALRAARAARAQRPAHALAPAGPLSARLLTGLPFTLTSAQQRVWSEVERIDRKSVV